MERIQYIVAEVEGRWYVMLQGRRHGPYAGRSAAVEDAIRGAQTVPNSQVLVQSAGGQLRVEWTHGTDPERYPSRE